MIKTANSTGSVYVPRTIAGLLDDGQIEIWDLGIANILYMGADPATGTVMTCATDLHRLMGGPDGMTLEQIVASLGVLKDKRVLWFAGEASNPTDFLILLDRFVFENGAIGRCYDDDGNLLLDPAAETPKLVHLGWLPEASRAPNG